MRKIKKRSGSAYVLVVMVFMVLSVFTALMVRSLHQTVYYLDAQAYQMKAYYLNREAEEAVVAVLLADEHALLKSLSGTMTDTMEHKNGAQTIGESEISLTKEVHKYYGENKDWVVARVTTRIDDKRANRNGAPFTYTGTVMVLIENPIVQLFNIQPESV